MQSSEASGAGANGFGAGTGDSSGRLRHPANSLTLAVAATAFAFATLFVVYDTVTTLAGVKRELALLGQTVATRIVDETPEAIDAVLASALGDYPSIARAGLIGDEPDVRDLLFTQVVPAGKHGMVSVEAEQSAVLSAIAGRGTAAFALAGLFTALTLRRRRDGGFDDPVQRRNYQTLAAAIPMGVACWSGDGNLLVCNDHYRKRITPTDEGLTYAEALKRLLAGGYMRLVREDGRNRVLELHHQNGSCLVIEERPLEDGGFLTLVSDVTERKRTDVLLSTIREEQRQLARRYHEEKIKAEAASRAKTNFLAHLSHDIRTPLNHIIGFAELMCRQTYGSLGDTRYAEYVQSIKTSGEHLLESFGAILDLAELENGRRVLRTDIVPVDEVIDSVCRRYRGQIERAGLALSVGNDCGAVLRADRLALVRMVGNIVDNAIRFTPRGGTLTLATLAAEDGVIIEITDTGIGMSEERLSSLSQPFALGDATFTREGVGPGLGVSISRAIAELSGGRLVVDSTPAVGTTVAISLPLDSGIVEAAA